MQRAEVLGMLMNRQKGIAVAGTHGKTTTSLIALLFEQNTRSDDSFSGQFYNLGVMLNWSRRIFYCRS